MSSSTKNVKLGVCRVFLQGVDLGLTQGGVEVTVSTETHKVEVDQFGKTPINELIMGRNVQAKVPMAEVTLRNMVAIMPGAVLTSDGVQAAGGVTFAGAPAATNTVTIGGQVFTFQAGAPTTAFQVKVGATQAESLRNLVNAINGAAQLMPAAVKVLGGVKATVKSAGNGIDLVIVDPGTAGNAITLTSTGGTASAATFAGGVNETKARVDVDSGIGVDLLSIAQVLRLHPTGAADGDFSDDFVIWAAATPGALTFAYKLDSERVYNVEFNGYPDPLTGKLFSVGTPLV